MDLHTVFSYVSFGVQCKACTTFDSSCWKGSVCKPWAGLSQDVFCLILVLTLLPVSKRHWICFGGQNGGMCILFAVPSKAYLGVCATYGPTMSFDCVCRFQHSHTWLIPKWGWSKEVTNECFRFSHGVHSLSTRLLVPFPGSYNVFLLWVLPNMCHTNFLGSFCMSSKAMCSYVYLCIAMYSYA